MQGLQKNPIFSLPKLTKQLNCILVPRTTQKGPHFYEIIFCSHPWGMTHMLPVFS